MGTEQQSIKTAYEDLKMSPQEIADDRGLDVVAVKASLMATSAQYRKDMSLIPESDLDFTDQELKDSNEAIVDTMKYATLADGSPDYRTRLAAATYVRDDKKGRKNPLKQIGPQFNLFEFNGSMQKIREAKDAILGSLSNSGQITNV